MIINVSNHREYILGNISDENNFVRAITPLPLLQTSAGVKVAFITDSKVVKIQYELDIKSCLQFAGRTLTNGLCYVIYNSSHETIIKTECLCSAGQFAVIHEQKIKDELYYELYLPSLNKVNKLYIDIEDDANIIGGAADTIGEKSPIVYMGGIITEGIGCTFASAMYSQILSRKLKRNFYNLAIGTNNFLNMDIANKVNTLNPAVIVTEIESVGMSAEYLIKSLYEYLQILLTTTTVPIVLISQPYWGDRTNDYDNKMKIVDEILKKLTGIYPSRLIYVNGEKVFAPYDYDSFSFSANFINDNGNVILAEYLLPILDSICI